MLQNATRYLIAALVLGALVAAVSPDVQAAVSGTLNYQAVLTSGGSPVTTPVTVVFTIYDAASGGTVLWTETRSVTPDGDGRVAMRLGEMTPIDASAFQSGDRWLGVKVESDAELAPRTPLASAPYSFRVATLDGAKGGTVSGSLTLDWSPALNEKSGPGDNNVSIGQNNNLSAAEYTFALGTSHLGAALNGFMLGESDSLYGNNSITMGTGNYVGGQSSFALGRQNRVGSDNSIVGGWGHYVAANQSTVFGLDNYVSGNSQVICFGNEDTVVNSAWGSILGGHKNAVVDAGDGVIVSGHSNKLYQAGISGIGSGQFNTIKGSSYSTIAGGQGNRISIDDNGGVTFHEATISGGNGNIASNANATISGGLLNTANGGQSTIGGGSSNTASGNQTTVAGGIANTSGPANGATVGGGEQNTASGQWATVAGGYGNVADGDRATVPGGTINRASGTHSFAAGRLAKAQHDYSFVWNGADPDSFYTTGTQQFLINAPGGVGIGLNNPSTALEVSGTVDADAFTINGTPVGTSSSSYWNQTGSDIYYNTGNVGIGTASPAYKLEVGSTSNAGNYLRINASTAGNLVFHDGGATNSGIISYDHSADAMKFYVGAAGTGVPTERMRMTSVGNVGIGTSTPAEKLDVSGNIHASGTITSGNSITLDGINDRISASTGTVEFGSQVAIGGNGVDGHLEVRGIGGTPSVMINTANGEIRPPLTLGGNGSNGHLEVHDASGTPTVMLNTVDGEIRPPLGLGGSGFDGSLTIKNSLNDTSFTADTSGIILHGLGRGFIIDEDAEGDHRLDMTAQGMTIGDGTNNTSVSARVIDMWEPTTDDSLNLSAQGMTVDDGVNNTTVSAIQIDMWENVTDDSLKLSANEIDLVDSGGIKPKSRLTASMFSLANQTDATAVTITQGEIALVDDGSLDNKITSGGMAISSPTQDSVAVLDDFKLRYERTGFGSADLGLQGVTFKDASGNETMKLDQASGILTFYDAGTERTTISSAGVIHDSLDASPFEVMAPGGTKIWSNDTRTLGVQLAANGTGWSSLSDRNVKENITPVDLDAILEEVAAIPVSTWNYRDDDARTRHIGPMAQDFYASFGVGHDDKHIGTLDADGVALAAIQALNNKNQELEARVAQLQKLVEQLLAERK